MALFFKYYDNDFNDLDALIDINNDSFPIEERMSIEELIHLAYSDEFNLLLIYDENEFIGFMLIVVYSYTVYIFLFAIAKNKRSKGYGSQALKMLKEYYSDYQIVLDLECIDNKAINLKQRQIRKKFYMNNGFFETGYFMKYLNMEFEVLCSYNDFDSYDFSLLLDAIKKYEFVLSIYRQVERF